MSALVKDNKVAVLRIPVSLYDFMTSQWRLNIPFIRLNIPFIRDTSLHDDISFFSLAGSINYLLAPLANLHIRNSDSESSVNTHVSSCLSRLLHEKTFEPTEC